MSPARALDQFYTSRPVAAACFKILESAEVLQDTDVFLEPSAGDGAFFELMPAERRVGVDLEPKYPNVAQQNFLTQFIPDPGVRRWVVVGNPPFGKNASLAVQFFNRAAEFADVIAFVVPLTFRKQSLQRRLHGNFELIADEPLKSEAFVFEGKPYAVPCSFQIWKRTDVAREHVLPPLVHDDFAFCKAEDAHFAIRRVGGLAGKVLPVFDGYSPASHYFIRSNIKPEVLVERFMGITWDDVKWNTAGNPSISKRELVAKYSAACTLRKESQRARQRSTALRP